VRVISGELGGRRLQAPRGRGTRPTSDRVREALCMVLEPWTGLRVVDLYAGSGALGIEALSRGAAFVDFVEHGRHALIALSANLEQLGLGDDRARVWRLELPSGLGRMREVLERADIVMLDPPYGGAEARIALEALGRAAVLAATCRVALEHHSKDEMPERTAVLERIAERRYGETQITFYGPRREAAPRAQEPGA
jgi:16S rRNA (guanine966-N2)-methyltransferase